jgi:hypothetical protein
MGKRKPVTPSAKTNIPNFAPSYTAAGWPPRAKRSLLVGASALALVAVSDVVIPPPPAWAVICQATGATPNSTANATDGGAQSNTACGLNANASGSPSHNTATGENANASGNDSVNTAAGFNTNATGGSSHNTAVGANASGTGSNNSAAGHRADAPASQP